MDDKHIEFSFCYASREQPLDRVVFRSTAGKTVPASVTDTDDIPAKRSKYPNFDHTSFRRVSLEFPFPQTLFAFRQSEEGDVPLFRIRATIDYPSFLFDILMSHARLVCEGPFRNFVETGTLFGHTCVPASFWFENTYSIELSEDLWKETQDIRHLNPGLNFLQGNSAEVLPRLIPELSGPTVFFLDAHWSGDDSVDWSSSRFSGFPTSTAHAGSPDSATPSPSCQVPLQTELEAIYDTFTAPALIIVDDWQSVGRKNRGFAKEDWTNLSKTSLTAYFGRHQRTLFHYPFDEQRYLIGISEQMSSSPEKGRPK